MFIQNNVPKRLRRPENLEMNETYVRHATTVNNNYRNRNARQKVNTIPVKRIAVYTAYHKVRKVSAEFKVPCVKRTFGKDIVRVCCRTIQQLDNIAAILEELMKFDFIMEIGMPLEYSYRMKSLVLFIKPKNSIAKVFEKCPLAYPHYMVEAEDPAIAAEKELNELTKEITQIVEAQKVQAEMEKVQTCTSNLPKEMNDPVQEEGIPATIIAQNGPTEEEEIESYYPRLLMFLKTAILFLSLYLIFDYELLMFLKTAILFLSLYLIFDYEM